MTKPDELDPFVRRAVSVDPVLIRDEYIRLPADLAIWNARLANAAQSAMEADLNLDRITAQLSMEHRAGLTSEGEKPTEQKVKERVETDARWITARMDAISTEADHLRAKGTVQAVLAKRDMLISLGATIRQELQDPSIRAQARDRAQRDDAERADDPWGLHTPPKG